MISGHLMRLFYIPQLMVRRSSRPDTCSMETDWSERDEDGDLIRVFFSKVDLIRVFECAKVNSPF